MGKWTVSRPAGYTILSDPIEGIIEADTLQCVHCGCHWQVNPGSRKIRGFCPTCIGPICGPNCVKCVPVEQRLENMEAGRPIEFRPIIIGT